MRMKNFNKLLATGATLAAAGLALTGCGSKSSSGSSKQILNWNEASELPTMDLSKATDTISFDMLNNSMEGLLRIGKNSKVEPGIAKSYKVSSDGLTYTFNLRKNAKWSNGDKVTADDFVYSWRRTVDPKTQSQYSYLFEGVKNIDDITAGKKAPSTLGIKAVGQYKVVVTLTKKVPYFKLLMGFPSFFPQNKTAVEKYGKKYGTSSKYMVYDGPFKMTGWTGTNLSWTLAKNKDYWDKSNVKLDKINFKVNKSTTTSYNLYQSKKLDQTILSTEQAKQLSNDPGYTIVKEARTNYLEFNQTKKEFQNKKIRQAIGYAIDRDQLAKKVMGSGTLPSKSVVSSGLVQKDGTDFTTAAKTTVGVTLNKKKAAQLWKEGLQELGESDMTITLLGDDTDAAKKITEFIQSQLEANLPGIKVEVANVPFKTRLARAEKGQFELLANGWSADFSDAISFLDLFTTGNPYNNGKWSNAEYDKLITASKTTDAGNADKRWDDMVKASKLINEEQPIVPLFQLNTPSLLRTNVKGVVHNTAGVSYNWKEAYIAK